MNKPRTTTIACIKLWRNSKTLIKTYVRSTILFNVKSDTLMKFLLNKMLNSKNSLFSKIKKVSQNLYDPMKTVKKHTSPKFPVSKIKSPSSKPQSTRLKKTWPKKQKCVNDTKSNTTSSAWRSTSTGNLTITWWTKTSTSWATKGTKMTEGWWASMK